MNARRWSTLHLRKDFCRSTWTPKPMREVQDYARAWGWWTDLKQKTKEKGSRCVPSSVSGTIRYVFGVYGDQAVAVAECESHLNVFATNGQYLGLFQMGEYARSRYGHSWTALGQSRAAYAYFKDSGSDWSPWQCRPWGLAW